MSVRIYRPSKTAMQSGRAKTKNWVLEPTLETARRPEPLMGWVSSGDTNNQVRLTFETKEEAVAYAKKHELDYIVQGDHNWIEHRTSNPTVAGSSPAGVASFHDLTLKTRSSSAPRI